MVLDYVNKEMGEVVTVVPNVGWTPFATSAGAVKGWAIIFRKNR